MRKRVVLAVLLVSACVASTFGQVPTVAPWDTTTMSKAGFTGLVEALHALESRLGDATLGSQKALGVDGWSSPRFARYTGGVLAGMGYRVLLSSGGAWPDAGHTWVLVLLNTPTASAWVPVEATPQAGQVQLSLGRIALAALSDAVVTFDSRYATSAQTEELPPNAAPTAGLRVSSIFVVVNTPIAMFSFLSGDPDGQIILYRWQIGTGPWFATTSPNTSGIPLEPGHYPVTLQVVDDLGASGIASVNISVNEAESTHNPAADCGCGH